jgi:phospholipid/cholesterol/gamma-HCH transport system substrate-binding protein
MLATKLLEDGEMTGKVAALLDKLTSTSAEAEKLVVSLNDFVNDPKLRQPMADTMANVKTMSDSGTRIAASAEEMAKNGVTISAKAIELTDKANLIADEARETLIKLQGFFQKVPSGNIFNKLETRMDLIREENPGRFRTDFEVVTPIKDFNLHVGIFDAFETNKLTVQMGQRFGRTNEYRYGVYAGKPGFGVDWRLAPNLHLEGNLFDLNNTRLDFRARYDFGKDFVGWLGFNRVFDGNAPMIGIGFRK